MESEQTEANDQAFPLLLGPEEYYEGLTKREFFAIQAYQITLNRPGSIENRARYAVEAADALINALNEEPEVIDKDLGNE